MWVLNIDDLFYTFAVNTPVFCISSISHLQLLFFWMYPVEKSRDYKWPHDFEILHVQESLSKIFFLFKSEWTDSYWSYVWLFWFQPTRSSLQFVSTSLVWDIDLWRTRVLLIYLNISLGGVSTYPFMWFLGMAQTLLLWMLSAWACMETIQNITNFCGRI